MSEPTPNPTPDPTQGETTQQRRQSEQRSSTRLISASAIMMAGTLASRVVGFGRLLLLAFLFGVGTRQADMFAVANAVPTSMYILLVGGVLNTVLVPQIVRAIKSDSDGGEAYTNRIMTGGLIVLFTITLLLTLAVPLIINLYSAGGWKDPDIAAQYASMVALGYYCMPQVFFYGVFVLAGQVLNARDRFGPMMWAPIANNVVSIAVLLIFLGVFGQTNPNAAFTPGQELLLGLGSTLGIAVQAAILVPYLRAVGYRFAPRFDFRGTGLGKTARLAKWTLGFVLVTQAGLVVINKVATAATVDGEGGGLAAYSYAYAVFIVPHSLITVSLATAMLPSASRLAHAGDLPGVAAEVSRTWRLALTALLPAAIAFFVLGVPMARLVFGFGAGAGDADFTGWALMTLSVGLVPFTLQYICLRAFYALENTRTPFFLQLLITSCYVTLGVLVSTLIDSDPLVAACLGSGLAMAYAIGVITSTRVLQRTLPDLALRPLARLSGRILAAFIPGMAFAGALVWGVETTSPGQLGRALALLGAVVIAIAGYLGMSRVLRVAEVADIVRTVLRRGGPTAAANDPGSLGDSTSVRPGASLTIGEAATAPDVTAGAAGKIDENADQMTNALSSDLDASTAPDTALNPDLHRERTPDALTPETPETFGSQGSHSRLNAGTVLADRYRLEELLAEAPPTVTWRAFDLMLSRSVLLHLLPPHDDGAIELLNVARQASVATDSRFLRVLDAVYSDDDEIGSYIVCEYATGQALELLLSHGPLSGLEAAWVVREVADALSGVHGLGLYHERINPDTVILTPDGHVKIVGLLIEKALRPPPGSALLAPDPTAGPLSPEDVDVADLGRLLYACLVSRWPGGPAFSLPAAPSTGRHWLSPRQVRAGVSPALDNVTDQILGDPPRRRAPRLRTANDVVNALTGVLGPADASADLERRLRQPIPRVTTTPPPAPLRHGQRPARAAVASVPPGGPSYPISPTITSDDATRVTVIRQPPPPVATRPTPVKAPAEHRPRRWIAIVALMGLLLIATGIVSAVALRQRSTSAAPPGASTASSPPTSSSASPVAPPAPPDRIASAREFDPQGDPPNEENTDEVRYAIDGKSQTRWRTVRYNNDPDLGGIKRGVGLVLDLGSPRLVNTVQVRLSGDGTDLQARIPKTDPAGTAKPPMSTDARWRTVSKRSRAGSTATLQLEEPATTRFVLVYLTSLPREGGGYRGGIYEVEVL